MLNPILNQLKTQPTNLVNLKNLISGDPQKMAQSLLNNNPQFRQFYEANKGKTAQEIAAAYGIDYTSLLSILK